VSGFQGGWHGGFWGRRACGGFSALLGREDRGEVRGGHGGKVGGVSRGEKCGECVSTGQDSFCTVAFDITGFRWGFGGFYDHVGDGFGDSFGGSSGDEFANVGWLGGRRVGLDEQLTRLFFVKSGCVGRGVRLSLDHSSSGGGGRILIIIRSRGGRCSHCHNSVVAVTAGISRRVGSGVTVF
jgi:hypothetical protein